MVWFWPVEDGSWGGPRLPDVDASYRRALDAGGLPVDEPRQREGDPDRRAGVKTRRAIPGGLLPSSVETSLQDGLDTRVRGSRGSRDFALREF